VKLEVTASEDGCASRKVSHLVGLCSRILMNPRVGMEVLIACSVL
jgi:hypothetical protein